MKDFMAGCIGAIVLVIFVPILMFAGGCLTGLILKWFIGDAVANGLNVLFNTTRFAPNMLPAFCGALAVVGSFFKSNASVSKN